MAVPSYMPSRPPHELRHLLLALVPRDIDAVMLQVALSSISVVGYAPKLSVKHQYVNADSWEKTLPSWPLRPHYLHGDGRTE